MKTPDFWRKNGILSEIMIPFSVFTFLYMRIRELLAGNSAIDFKIPIICVGNITAGGAGKTPVAIALAKILSNKKVAFVSRGYGGKLVGPVKVALDNHSAEDVGDEPLLLARIASCWIAKNRKEGIKAAIADGAEIIILDDGLQDIYIKKDLSFAVIDGKYGFGNGLVLPAGPLRDRVDKALAHADAAIIIGKDKNDIIPTLEFPVIQASIHSTQKIKDEEFVAFAGIGLPEKFFSTLRNENLRLVETVKFADHYKYSAKDIEGLVEKAEELNARLITTEKDAVRITSAFLEKITIFPIEIKWENKKSIKDLIKDYL